MQNSMEYLSTVKHSNKVCYAATIDAVFEKTANVRNRNKLWCTLGKCRVFFEFMENKNTLRISNLLYKFALRVTNMNILVE